MKVFKERYLAVLLAAILVLFQINSKLAIDERKRKSDFRELQ